MTKRRLISIVILIVLTLSAMVVFSGCKRIYVYQDETGEMYFALDRDNKTAALNYCNYDQEHFVCEIPSHIEYEGEIYTVTSIEPEMPVWGGHYEYFSNRCLREIIVPATIEKLDMNFKNNMERLEKVTVHPDNETYKSIDGVVYTKDGTELIYYPLGNSSELLTLTKTLSKIDYTVNKNTHIKQFVVEEGNEVFKSEDGVLYSADGTELICYPSDKDDNHFAVPQTVKKIRLGSMVFDGKYMAGKGCNLATVYIPSSVEIIENHSFFHRLKVYCEKPQTDTNYNIQSYVATYWDVGFEEYERIISTWEETANDKEYQNENDIDIIDNNTDLPQFAYSFSRNSVGVERRGI